MTPYRPNILWYIFAVFAHASASEGFSSHVTVNTPARSYSHGVGDPILLLERRSYQYRSAPRYSIPPRIPLNNGRRIPSNRPVPPRIPLNNVPPRIPFNSATRGYPRIRPFIPFDVEEVSFRGNSISTPQLEFPETSIPVLPISPYKIDSPDPESLWPDGLFLPPRFGFRQRTDDEVQTDAVDPFLLEGSEAIAAVIRSKKHGIYWFHDIPHLQSLLANQEIRKQNNLEPIKIGSIRHSWPFNRL